ncbi:MAG: hypothetical protein PHN16_05200, partial [Candidatus Omnitrophica bacterium]|nr:hypothetical protein [Candidatus Omnitrophota bacterium]
IKKLFTLTILLAVVFCAVNAFAATSQTVNVSATVPTTNGLSVSVHKIIGTVWSEAAAINFGTLEWDSELSMFLPADGEYYALDVKIDNNSGTDWTVSHAHQSLSSGTNNLDNNVNVTFVKVANSDEAESPLEKVSFASSNKSYAKSTLLNSWLRIYYGISTGSEDATGVTPLGASTVAGTYTGSVTLTLS